MNKFLENVKNELNKRGMTQKELAEKTGISVNTIRGWFSKDFTPDIFSAAKIAYALETSTEFLISGKTLKYELTQETKELIDLYDKLNQEQKNMVTALLSAITKNVESDQKPEGNN